MRAIILAVVIILMLCSCHGDDSSRILIADDLPKAKPEYQRIIVGHLSGKYELANETRIRSRWSEDERTLAASYLKQLLEQLNITPQEHSYTAPNLNPAIDFILDPFKGTNIYGILPATGESNEYIVLGAHYDTGKRNAPGAIDNATGIALIYSVVNELSKVQTRNKHVVIVFFDQEEEELIGSKAFVKFMQGKPWDIHSVHCFDMVGWDGDGDGAMEIFTASETLRDIYAEAARKHGIPLKEIIIDPVGYDVSSTDFDVFVPEGYNVIGAGECFYHRDSSPYKDSPKDTFETVNFEYLLSCSNLIEDVIKTLASP
ncbi:M20/M25/M40 family metallo-hydrolase [Fulvivirga ulvae]|uniref:M28 family metallopeptidase n=1 Tax=Fulvivirga ulvae TaxID=2904245 RepID=UPI001F1867AF|nr:M20/M25/M40 family metallo-hydrolase [Fulvivirga ulvae]UII29887.1 M20/M25/M40 family metallo-hydrolase [Fulvivirga ulvae]